MRFNCIAKLAEKEENAEAKNKLKISKLSGCLSAKSFGVGMNGLKFSAEHWISELSLVKGLGTKNKA